MIKNNSDNTKYGIKTTSSFNKCVRKIIRQGRQLDKLNYVIARLANGEILSREFRNHNLINNKYYNNCKECHIGPDWLLIYKYIDNELILLLISTGSHSELFNN
jgi:mRNA interferase YafQ